MCGLYHCPQGLSTGENPENKIGFFQGIDIRVAIDSILSASGATWDNPFAFSFDKVNKDIMPVTNCFATEVFLGMENHNPWFAEEPGFCLLLPFCKKE